MNKSFFILFVLVSCMANYVYIIPNTEVRYDLDKGDFIGYFNVTPNMYITISTSSDIYINIGHISIESYTYKFTGPILNKRIYDIIYSNSTVHIMIKKRSEDTNGYISITNSINNSSNPNVEVPTWINIVIIISIITCLYCCFIYCICIIKSCICPDWTPARQYVVIV